MSTFREYLSEAKKDNFKFEKSTLKVAKKHKIEVANIGIRYVNQEPYNDIYITAYKHEDELDQEPDLIYSVDMEGKFVNPRFTSLKDMDFPAIIDDEAKFRELLPDMSKAIMADKKYV